MGKTYYIRTKHQPGMYRAGEFWPYEGRTVKAEDLKKGVLEKLKKDPHLFIKETVEADEAGGNPGGAPGPRYRRFRAKSTGETLTIAGQRVHKSKWQVFQGADNELMTAESLDLVAQLVKDGALVVEVMDPELDKYRPLAEGEGLKV